MGREGGRGRARRLRAAASRQGWRDGEEEEGEEEEGFKDTAGRGVATAAASGEPRALPPPPALAPGKAAVGTPQGG